MKATWRLEGTSSAELRNFRFMTDDWKNQINGSEPTRKGLNTLRISASTQPNAPAFSTLREKILQVDSNAKIYIVDLRQESHGFVNSMPVSYYINHNAANAGKSSVEVEILESDLLNNLRGVETTFTPLGKSDTKNLKPEIIIPNTIQTEHELAKSLNLEYKRFAVADHQFPTPELVDDFLKFVSDLPRNAWLHFHCKAGHGRTTTFAVFYDILKNPDLTLEEICARQYLLGGTNLLLESEGGKWESKMAFDRAKKIRLFYQFAHDQRNLSWSEYLRLNGFE